MTIVRLEANRQAATKIKYQNHRLWVNSASALAFDLLQKQANVKPNYRNRSESELSNFAENIKFIP